ncbi:hypothetical protein V502_04175 [Pseudogymnoascus sp. VKM F-4520 (FW-2644)]|nr:hypothetical protein V502_04175 [Pseudogymnoascus sp. VKM F-4520 (FW-2644)]
MSQTDSYHQAPATPHRLPANPDEDWTQISDLAARRRIQNRIAQRNYRKKLKRRLDDLKRCAGSCSASPPQSQTELKPSKPIITKMHKTPSRSRRTTKISPRATYQTPHQYIPPLTQSGDLFPLDHAISHTPPHFTYVPYSAPDEDLNPFGMSYAAMAGLDIQHAYDDPLVSPSA